MITWSYIRQFSQSLVISRPRVPARDSDNHGITVPIFRSQIKSQSSAELIELERTCGICRCLRTLCRCTCCTLYMHAPHAPIAAWQCTTFSSAHADSSGSGPKPSALARIHKPSICAMRWAKPYHACGEALLPRTPVLHTFLRHVYSAVIMPEVCHSMYKAVRRELVAAKS